MSKAWKVWNKYQEEKFAKDSVIEEVLALPVQRERVDLAVKFIGNGKHVLDVGAGDAGISELMRRNNNEVVSLDFPKVIATALPKSKKYRDTDLPIYLVAAEATFLPFKDKNFDAILCGEIIEHILNVTDFLAGLHRILKEDGLLVLTTPNVVRLRNRLEMLMGSVRGWHEWDKDFTHLRYWTHADLIECLKKNLFEPLEFGGGGSMGAGPPIEGWGCFTEEERKVLKGIVTRFSPQPAQPALLSSFVVIKAKKITVKW